MSTKKECRHCSGTALARCGTARPGEPILQPPLPPTPGILGPPPPTSHAEQEVAEE